MEAPMSITENRQTGSYIVAELPGTMSRRFALLADGAAVQAGTILQSTMTGAGEKISGTGNGTVGAVTVGAFAQPGTYVLTCIAASADAGTFSVTAPDGSVLPNLTVAVAYVSSHFGVTVADGSTDWGAGAVIHVVITETEVEPLSTGVASGILYSYADATADEVPVVIHYRDCAVNGNQITFPAGATAGRLAQIRSQLAARGITIQ